MRLIPGGRPTIDNVREPPVVMHVNSEHRQPLELETRQERRDRVFRIRHAAKTQESPRERIEPSDDQFFVIGQTMSPHERLPSIGHRRNYNIPMADVLAGKAPLGIQGFGRTLEALNLSPLRMPTCAARPIDIDGSNDEVFMPDVMERHRSPNHVHGPRTAPGGFRRWSDFGQPEFHVAIRPAIQTLGFRRASDIENAVQTLDDAIPSYVEMLDNPESAMMKYQELHAKYERANKGLAKEANGSHHQPPKRPGHVPPLNRETEKAIARRVVQRKSTVCGDGFGKPQKNTSTTNTRVLQKRRSVLMPSGGNNNALHRSSSSTQAKTTSSTRLMQRKNSKIGRSLGNGKKSEANLKNKKEQDSPPGPSQEEMQEIEEVPVFRKFLKMPPSRPKVVCFDYPGVDLSHWDVKDGIEKVIPDAFSADKVVSIQFENVNVKLGTGGLDNRWLIELRDFTTRNKLIKYGLSLECAHKAESISDLSSVSSNEAGPSGLAEEEERPAPAPIEYPKSVSVKLYDSVSMEEYKLFLRRTAAEEKLHNVILLCAGRGDKLLSTML